MFIKDLPVFEYVHGLTEKQSVCEFLPIHTCTYIKQLIDKNTLNIKKRTIIINLHNKHNMTLW